MSAENERTPVSGLRRLAHMDVMSIRESVAVNCRATSEILDYLARTSSARVQRVVAQNPNVSVETLKFIVGTGTGWAKDTAKMHLKQKTRQDSLNA